MNRTQPGHGYGGGLRYDYDQAERDEIAWYHLTQGVTQIRLSRFFKVKAGSIGQWCKDLKAKGLDQPHLPPKLSYLDLIP